MFTIRIVCILTALALWSTPAGSYKLLKGRSVESVEPRYMKWGETLFKKSAIIRYGFVTRRLQFEKGFANNCDTIEPLTELIEQSGLTLEIVKSEARRAVNVWSEAAGITFIYTDDEKNTDVFVGAQVDPKGGAWADVRVRSSEGETNSIEKGVICFNPKKYLTLGKADCVITFNVHYTIAHEFGHIIGIDHPQNAGVLMAYKCPDDDRVMTHDDSAAAQHLYGLPPVKP